MKTYIAYLLNKNTLEKSENFTKKYYYDKDNYFACQFIYTDTIGRAKRKASELKNNDSKNYHPHVRLYLECIETSERYCYYNYSWIKLN